MYAIGEVTGRQDIDGKRMMMSVTQLWDYTVIYSPKTAQCFFAPAETQLNGTSSTVSQVAVQTPLPGDLKTKGLKNNS